jgi:ATP-dependent DNA helicase RecQ
LAEFEKLGVNVIGASVDSHYTHLAWKNTPRKQGGLGEIDFPLLSDLSRKASSAYGVLLSGQEELDITDWFIRSAFPSRQEVADVLGALEKAENGLSVPELLSRVNLSKGRVDKTIALLSLEAPAPIAKQGTKWQLTAATLSEAFWERAERLTALRRDEHQQMQDYVSLPFGEHMGFLIGALDGDPSVVTRPALPPLPTDVDEVLVRDAIEFLRRTSLPIEPRKKWPDGGMPQYGVKGFIAHGHQAQPGKALCVWGDAGWGGLVRRGKYHDGNFEGSLNEAMSKGLPQTIRRVCLINFDGS